MKIPGSIRGDILLSPPIARTRIWITAPSQRSVWGPKHQANGESFVIGIPVLGQNTQHIISTCNWGHFTKILDLKNTKTPPINYPSFRISFEIELKRSHVKVEFPKFVVEVFNMPKFNNKYPPNNHHNHRMQSFVIWEIQLGISQLHLGKPTARPGKSSGWKMILSFWDGLFLGGIVVSEVITLNQIGKSR